METNKKRVIIVHGRNSEANSGWYGWLSRELKNRGFEVKNPQMPGEKHPRLEEWIQIIAEVVGVPDKDTYFVGHSLGCISIIRYIAQLPFDVTVGGCVFVGGFYEDIGIPEITEFTQSPVDFEKVKMHTKNFVTIISRNDDRVSLDKAMNLQKVLEAEPVIEMAGHFRESDGITDLEPALQNVLKMAS